MASGPLEAQEPGPWKPGLGRSHLPCLLFDCHVCHSSWAHTLLHMAPWARPEDAPDALGVSFRYVHPKLLFASIPAPFCSDSNFLSLSPPVSLCSLETASFAKMSFSYGNFSVPLCLNLIYPTLEFLVSISDCTPSLSSLKAQLIFHIFHVPQVLNTWPCTEYIPKLFL